MKQKTGFTLSPINGNFQHQFFGKFKAQVTNNQDPEKRGRVKVRCPKVLGKDESGWCVPCLPFAGMDKGLFFLPEVGDFIWIEFEEGNPDLPIWVGSWWNSSEPPTTAKQGVHTLKTGKISMTFDEEKEVFIVQVKGEDATATLRVDGKTGLVTF